MFVSTTPFYQPRDAPVCTPLLIPTIFVSHSAFSRSDQPHSASASFCADRSLLYLVCCSIPLFSLLRSSSLSLRNRSSSSSLLQSARLYLCSASFFSPLASSNLCFNRIGSALIPQFGSASAWFGSVSAISFCSALSFAPLDLLISLKITYHYVTDRLLLVLSGSAGQN